MININMLTRVLHNVRDPLYHGEVLILAVPNRVAVLNMEQIVHEGRNPPRIPETCAINEVRLVATEYRDQYRSWLEWELDI